MNMIKIELNKGIHRRKQVITLELQRAFLSDNFKIVYHWAQIS